jgi:large subunit ribosomal protein L25
MELKAEKREKLGKAVKALLKAGFIPAELYGKGIPNLHLSLPVKDFKKVYKSAGENTIVNIVVDDQKFPSIISDVARDYLTSEPIHVDLHKVRMDEKLQTKVPLEFTGESLAVKDLGGVLIKSMQELAVEALPDKIPHKIFVDISKLIEIGNTIRVEDLVIPADVKVLVDGRTAVATVSAKVTEEQEAALRAEGAAPEEVKVETEEKKAEREAAKAAEAPAEGASAEAKKQ